MKIAAASLLGATLFATSAHAATNIETDGFSLQFGYIDTGMFNPKADMNLLSHSNGTYQIDLTGLGYIDTTHEFGSGYYEAQLIGSVNSGYRITSLSLSAKFDGNAHVTNEPPAGWGTCAWCSGHWGSGGEAYSGGMIEWTVQSNLLTTLGPLEQITGPETLQVTYDQTLSGDFDMLLRALVYARAKQGEGGYYDGSWVYYQLPAGSWATVSDVKLTVQVERVLAVPEPTTYGMLLGGLGILGFAAYRRNALT